MNTAQPLFTAQEWLTSTADELRGHLEQARIEERHELQSWLQTHSHDDPRWPSVETELLELRHREEE